MIVRVGDQNSKKFVISESVFRFGADVRTGDDPREAQLRLIRDGEATTPELLTQQAVGLDEEIAEDAETEDDVEQSGEE